MNGINVGGYLRTESGMGSAVRGYLRALRSLALPIALKDVLCTTGVRTTCWTYPSVEELRSSTGNPMRSPTRASCGKRFR